MKNHYIGQEFVMQREIIADEIQQQAHMLDRILQAKALGPYRYLFLTQTALGPMSHSK